MSYEGQRNKLFIQDGKRFSKSFTFTQIALTFGLIQDWSGAMNTVDEHWIRIRKKPRL